MHTPPPPDQPATTPKSAIISIPPDWSIGTGNTGQWGLDSQPMSASSSSSSSNALFAWPDPIQDTDDAPSSDEALTERRGSAVYVPNDISPSTPSSPPRFNRTFSAPLPTSRGLLRQTPTVPTSPLTTLSSELADSLQSAIQTLLHLSPPHLLDNAKEQYSGCAVQMPTTSVSALLTSMRSLNYLAANVHALSESTAPLRKTEDFDIGELVQNVADLLGGQAAQAGVDLVLFHGDVGIKHVSVNGDVEGLGYVLGHILRQILLVAGKGDIIEIGLQLIPQSPSSTPRPDKRDPSTDTDGPLLCIFEIIHNAAQAASTTPRAEINPFSRLAEDHAATTPKLDTLLCQRLLEQQRATLKKDIRVTSPLSSGMPRKGYELSVLLPRGEPLIANLSAEEDAARQPFAGMCLAREPTLPELSTFAESLRGKKVALHASLSSLFARHLTSYLGAWGLDISHTPIEDDGEPTPTLSLNPDRFIIIDDDVAVLRRELTKMCSDSSLLKPKPTKRPAMGLRAKSTPLLRPTMIKGKSPVLIHFTSLANYNQVRDVVASIFGPSSARDGAFYHPEVMVIPKPVGPRRFLTALHTAVNQPMVDPSFSPIATTPRSPGGYLWARTPNETPRDGFFESVVEEQAPEPTPTPATEYFNAPSGVIIQSPDGRFGIQFEPPVRGERRSSYSQRAPEKKPRCASVDVPSTSPQPLRRQSNLSDAPERKSLPTNPPLVVQGRQRSSTVTQRQPPPTPTKKKKEEVVVPPINVLIVEDNPINQNILSMFLRKKKIKHSSAKDGQEAIEKWRTGGFHLILMDIQLPVMDGITATRLIRGEEKDNCIGVYPSTPMTEVSRNLETQLRSSVIIVALTASSLHSDRVAALAAGCNDFLTKPVSLKWLERKIVEWGCMQALIDFDGWKRWKGADGRDSGETKRGFSVGPQQAARGVADRLRIERKRPLGAIREK